MSYYYSLYPVRRLHGAADLRQYYPPSGDRQPLRFAVS